MSDVLKEEEVGSEGAWTEQEEHDILDHGYKAISLGP